MSVYKKFFFSVVRRERHLLKNILGVRTANHIREHHWSTQQIQQKLNSQQNWETETILLEKGSIRIFNLTLRWRQLCLDLRWAPKIGKWLTINNSSTSTFCSLRSWRRRPDSLRGRIKVRIICIIYLHFPHRNVRKISRMEETLDKNIVDRAHCDIRIRNEISWQWKQVDDIIFSTRLPPPWSAFLRKWKKKFNE